MLAKVEGAVLWVAAFCILLPKVPVARICKQRNWDNEVGFLRRYRSCRRNSSSWTKPATVCAIESCNFALRKWVCSKLEPKTFRIKERRTAKNLTSFAFYFLLCLYVFWLLEFLKWKIAKLAHNRIQLVLFSLFSLPLTLHLLVTFAGYKQVSKLRSYTISVRWHE